MACDEILLSSILPSIELRSAPTFGYLELQSDEPIVLGTLNNASVGLNGAGL